MAPPRQIPGFYWDEDKKRYFQIQPGHQATPAARQNHSSNLRRDYNTRVAASATEWARRQREERVQRSMALYNPPSLVMREISSWPFNTPRVQRESQARTIARQLRNSWKLDTVPTFSGVGFDPNESNEFEIKCVLRDPRTGTIMTASSRSQASAIMVSYPDIVDDKWVYGVDGKEEVEILEEPYDLTSMSFSSLGGHLCTTLNLGPNGDGFITIHPFPDITEHGFFEGFGRPFNMRIKTRTSFWDSAVLRESSIATFAVGTSKGLRIARQTPSQWIFPPHIYEDEHATAIESRLSVNAVDWINNDIVVAGMRSKAVVLHDTRVRHGGVFRMRHDNPVFQVKKVDDYRILAGGPQSLKMYDQRWAADTGQPSQPYLDFPQFVGKDRTRFDLNTELGLVVAPCEIKPSLTSVQSFSLQTGRRIDNPLAKVEYDYDYKRIPLSVTFDRDNDRPSWRGPRGPSLLFGGDGQVEEWTWGG